jgi:mono/diheme cytochrome c family protein
VKFTFACCVVLTAFGVSAQSADLPGKAIYDQTCKRCHGLEGKGDTVADKFFQVSIPRLNSAYVQQKSAAELKEVITHGRRNMEPVRIGQPVAKHDLAPGQVDDVVAYVRTFAKKAK